MNVMRTLVSGEHINSSAKAKPKCKKRIVSDKALEMESILSDGLWHRKSDVLQAIGVNSKSRLLDCLGVAEHQGWICMPRDHTPIDPPGD